MVPQAAIDLIKKWEGLRLKPYLCSAGVPTIGYGSTFYEDGTKVTLADQNIDEERAEALLAHEVEATGVRVRLMAKNASEGQYGALVSFAYNVGAGALRASTLLRKHNAGDYEGAARQFANWKYAGGKASAGLIARRADEREMYEAT